MAALVLLVEADWCLITERCCAPTVDDIAVRFYEQDDEGNVRWEDYANFANHDVHRQVMLLQIFFQSGANIQGVPKKWMPNFIFGITLVIQHRF